MQAEKLRPSYLSHLWRHDGDYDSIAANGVRLSSLVTVGT
jgi:hypothetical protein